MRTSSRQDSIDLDGLGGWRYVSLRGFSYGIRASRYVNTEWTGQGVSTARCKVNRSRTAGMCGAAAGGSNASSRGAVVVENKQGWCGRVSGWLLWLVQMFASAGEQVFGFAANKKAWVASAGTFCSGDRDGC